MKFSRSKVFNGYSMTSPKERIHFCNNEDRFQLAILDRIKVITLKIKGFY